MNDGFFLRIAGLKNYFALLAILFLTTGLNEVIAQSPQNSIFESLNNPKSGEGIVVVHQSEAIKRLVGTRIDSEYLNSPTGKTFIATRGYRIQVYSGNNQRTSKDEATSLQENIKSLYPNHESDIKFIAPFWKLFVGNFLTYEEAWTVCRELRNVYPQKKNEIYIIEDDILLSMDNL